MALRRVKTQQFDYKNIGIFNFARRDQLYRLIALQRGPSGPSPTLAMLSDTVESCIPEDDTAIAPVNLNGYARCISQNQAVLGTMVAVKAVQDGVERVPAVGDSFLSTGAMPGGGLYVTSRTIGITSAGYSDRRLVGLMTLVVMVLPNVEVPADAPNPAADPFLG